MTGRSTFPRRERLRSRAEIVRVLRTGGRRRSGSIDAFLAESTAPISRAAVIVPRHGHDVVERNRIRRRLRELIRTRWIPGARHAVVRQDLVIRARPAAYDLDFESLAADFERTVGGR